MGYETILCEVDDAGVATITLNRPEQRNAINFEMDGELSDAFAKLDADEAVRAIVVTGAGKAFCAGFDLSGGGNAFGRETHEAHDSELGVDSDQIAEKWSLWNLSTPVIGAINGAAVGVGMTMALLFDVCYAAEDAKLSFVFTRRGIIPEANSTWILPRLVGVTRALELMLGARTISGYEAADIGLIARSLPREDVLRAAQEFAREIAIHTAPGATALVKRLVYDNLAQTDRLAAMQRETKITWWAGEQPDAVEGVMSYLEKRDPKWQGSKHVDLPEPLRDPLSSGG